MTPASNSQCCTDHVQQRKEVQLNNLSIQASIPRKQKSLQRDWGRAACLQTRFDRSQLPAECSFRWRISCTYKSRMGGAFHAHIKVACVAATVPVEYNPSSAHVTVVIDEILVPIESVRMIGYSECLVAHCLIIVTGLTSHSHNVDL